jgi:hypothetical protein
MQAKERFTYPALSLPPSRRGYGIIVKAVSNNNVMLTVGSCTCNA